MNWVMDFPGILHSSSSISDLTPRFLLAFGEVAVPAVDEGDEGSVPRPPVEITSGWDVPWRQSVLFGFSDGLVGIKMHVYLNIYPYIFIYI